MRRSLVKFLMPRYPTEFSRACDLEFFNRIGRKRTPQASGLMPPIIFNYRSSKIWQASGPNCN